jgi:isopentenyl diphosphate isomerase/L-lactate dehydrogenase-like FMN-dependent dehydrogenase
MRLQRGHGRDESDKMQAMPRRGRPPALSEIVLDGGIRRGSDVVKAVALGTRRS